MTTIIFLCVTILLLFGVGFFIKRSWDLETDMGMLERQNETLMQQNIIYHNDIKELEKIVYKNLHAVAIDKEKAEELLEILNRINTRLEKIDKILDNISPEKE